MIDVLLATFNGEDYLKELLDSLFNQSYANIRIIACDDGSSDQTVAILYEMQRKSPVPVEIYQNRTNMGVTQTFSKLMGLSKAPYIMFCDQDDIWKPTKVEVTFRSMKEAEKNPNKPVLVHTDLKVVDANINEIHSSYWNFTHIYPKKTKTLNRFLVQNVVTGCTVMMNRALVEKCGAIPRGAIMHDWWVALVASAFGKVVPLDESTIYYRQHASNCLGAKRFFSLSSISESFKKQRSMSQKKYRQAQKFASVYHNLLTNDQLQLIDNYTTISDQSWFKKLALTFKYKYYRQGLARNLAFLFVK